MEILNEEDLEEERRCVHTARQRERRQIDEAVLYHVTNQKLSRDRRANMMHMKNNQMKWEIDTNNALNDSSYYFTL